MNIHSKDALYQFNFRLCPLDLSFVSFNDFLWYQRNFVRTILKEFCALMTLKYKKYTYKRPGPQIKNKEKY